MNSKVAAKKKLFDQSETFTSSSRMSEKRPVVSGTKRNFLNYFNSESSQTTTHLIHSFRRLNVKNEEPRKGQMKQQVPWKTNGRTAKTSQGTNEAASSLKNKCHNSKNHLNSQLSLWEVAAKGLDENKPNRCCDVWHCSLKRKSCRKNCRFRNSWNPS